MWFISPPVPQHKEQGVLLTLCMAQSQPSTAARWAGEHPVPMGNTQAGALEALFKFCWVSCAYIKILHLAQGKPREPDLCSYWGVSEQSTEGWGKFKSQVGTSKQKKGSFPSTAEESSAPEVPSSSTGRFWGPPGLRAVPCWVWGTISAQQNYFKTNIQSYWAEGTETRGQGPVSYWSHHLPLLAYKQSAVTE